MADKDGVLLLGSGTCRLSARRSQTAACVRQDDFLFLFDVGAGIPSRLAEADLLTGCRELHVHISHRHTDHLLGLFALLQGLTWSDSAADLFVEKVVVHATEEVVTLVQAVRRLWGEVETDLNGLQLPGIRRTLEFSAGPDYADWNYLAGPLEISSVHLPSANNHGVRFELGGASFAFTADASELSPALINFCRGADIVVLDAGHMSNSIGSDHQWHVDALPIAQLAAASSPGCLVLTHIYLRSLQQQPLGEEERRELEEAFAADCREKAGALGYRGEILCGEDLMRLPRGS